MTNVQWGILSTAGIAQKQLIPAFQRAANAEVTAIASSSGLKKAEAVADKFSIEKAYNSYEKLLDDPEIDAVYIPLPNHLHKEWTVKAAKKGKHILSEKPATVNAAELEEIKLACEEHRVSYMEAFMYHFHPQHDRVREIIDLGEIGDVSYMRAAHSFPMKDPESNVRMKYQAGGGSLYDLGCYAIHAIRNVLRQEPESVQVQAIKDNGVDTDAYAYLTFPDGVHATFDSSFNLTDRNEYEVVGTEGRILVPRAFRPDKNGGDGLIIVEKQGVSRTETVNTDQYRDQVEHISEAILKGENHLHNDFENTLGNMRVIDACVESMETGGLVKLG
ncbi:oxidoreductase [Virgibacillus phasianinus]|uniref:Oxidoreductase n=1 Tax=Virgibacillus phasianinus TaxID=2017483 RepID=A0A220U2Z8_9BACI|nr:Gfo/Idh/MocA family oxidoreductase [Virgibacillus phasianinus]ASK62191.1 oxidoreductase [Virgibacillus phasianinus]